MLKKPLRRHFIILTIICLLFPSLIGGKQSQSPSPLQAAEEAFSRGDYQKAKEQFTLAFQSGTSLEAGTGLAETLLKLDDWKGAQDVAFKAMRLRSTSPDATALYADALFRGGNLNDAGLHYLRALSLDQQNARALVGLAVMKLSRGENSEALSYLRDAIAAAPQTARAYYWIGAIFQNEGRYPESAQAYNKFLSFKATGYPESVLADRLDATVELLRRFGNTTPFSIVSPSVITIPFDFSQNVPIVTMTINRHPARFLVDSNVQNVVYFEQKFATSVSEQASVPANGQKSVLINFPSLKLGDMTANQIPVCITSRSNLEETFNKKLPDVDGVLGLSWLRSSVVTFDYQNHTMTIAPPSPEDSSHRLIAPLIRGTAPKVSLRMPFQLIRQQIILPGAIGDNPISILLSTGQNSSLVSADFASNNFKPEAMVKNGDAYYVKNLVLNFGGQDIASPNVDISQKLDDTVSKSAGLQFGAALGQQFMRNLSRLSIDFANMIVTFEIDQSKSAAN